jgi:hypothetical protein
MSLSCKSWLCNDIKPLLEKSKYLDKFKELLAEADREGWLYTGYNEIPFRETIDEAFLSKKKRIALQEKRHNAWFKAHERKGTLG